MTATLACLALLTTLAAEPERRDAVGDPLPPYAVTRLGTDRLALEWCRLLEFSPDDRLLVGRSDHGDLRVWDAASGRLLWSAAPWDELWPNKFGRDGWSAAAWSPDGKQLAAAHPEGTIRLFDAATGRQIEKFHRAPPAATHLAFQPNGHLLAASGQEPGVTLWDLEEGKLFGSRKTTDSPVGLAWTADGKSLVAVGGKRGNSGECMVTVWDAAGKELKQYTFEQKGKFPGALSRDGRWYAMPSEDYKTLHLLDALTGKDAGRIEAGVRLVPPPSFASGGRYLTAPSYDGIARLWEVEGGKLVRQFEATKQLPVGCAVSSDGKRLAIAEVGGVVSVWDAAKGKPPHDLPGHRGDQGVTVAFSADGKSVYTAATERGFATVVQFEWWHEWSLRRWDAATGKELHVRREEVKKQPGFLLFSPDGRRLAVADVEGRLEIWDTERAERLSTGALPTRDQKNISGDKVWVFQRIDFGRPVFTGDGRVLLGGSSTGIARWDVEANKPLPTLDYPDKPGPNYTVWSVGLGGSRSLLVTARRDKEYELAQLDVETGAPRRRLTFLSRGLTTLVGSPDGRLVVVHESGRCVLCEMADGARRLEFDLGGKRCTAAAFSPDGRLLFLAVAAKARETTIRVIRRSTGELLRELKDDRRGGVTTLVVSPDGTRLASAGGGTAVLIWDVGGLSAPKPGGPLGEKDAEALWNDLRGDGAAAHRAIARLAEAGAPAVAALRPRTKALAPPDEKRVAQLLKDLDAEEFETRERASEELEKLGDKARGALRGVLAGQSSTEAKRRAMALLEKLDKGGAPSAEVTWLRVVEALEFNASPEARDWLRELAKDPPSKAVGADVEAALARLKDRGKD
jgi:WD40 repeat protein